MTNLNNSFEEQAIDYCIIFIFFFGGGGLKIPTVLANIWNSKWHWFLFNKFHDLRQLKKKP